jgi:undecaprenyl-diphosphatase
MKLEKDSGKNSRYQYDLLLSVWRSLVELFGVRLLIGLGAAVAALFFFGWLADEVLEGETQRFDETVRSSINQLSTPIATDVMRFFTFSGSTLFLLILGVCFIAAFVFAGWRRSALLFAATMLGAIILNYSLKISFQRTRPEPYFNTPLPSSYSFPSGHALFALCFYGILAWLVTARIKSRAAAIGIWIITILFIIFIGLSRIYLGVHYPSDVLAGYAAALVWVVTVVTCDFWLKARKI